MASLADMLAALMQGQKGVGARGLMMPVGDVVPFRNPLGQSANQLQPETLAKLREAAAQSGLSMEMLKYLIAQQMQQQGK